MDKARALLDVVDRFLIRFMDVVGIPFLRVGVGIVFIWFGAPEPEVQEEPEDLDSPGSDGPSDDSDAGGTGIPEVIE